MNAKDMMIQSVQHDSEWFALAKSITRADAARLIEARRTSARTQEVPHAKVQHGQ